MSETPQGRFPKSTHLLKHSDFQRVYQQGHRHFSGNMTVFYLPAALPRSLPCVRIGLTVPKALGGAVQRNRMRRRTREAVRQNLVLLNEMRGGVDVVINPKKGLLQAEFAQVSREVERAFKMVRGACERDAEVARAKESGPKKGVAKKSRGKRSGARSARPQEPSQ